MSAIKVIEVLGVSTNSWEDAANEALQAAQESVRNISGLEIVSQTAKVKDGKITEYHTTCKMAFRVE